MQLWSPNLVSKVKLIYGFISDQHSFTFPPHLESLRLQSCQRGSVSLSTARSQTHLTNVIQMDMCGILRTHYIVCNDEARGQLGGKFPAMGLYIVWKHSTPVSPVNCLKNFWKQQINNRPSPLHVVRDINDFKLYAILHLNTLVYSMLAHNLCSAQGSSVDEL